MHGISEEELDAAIGLLMNRMDDDLEAELDIVDYAESLYEYLRRRDIPRLLFSPEKLETIARAARKYDPDEWRWETEIADNAVDGRAYGASNAYCRRFIDIHTPDFDFSTYEHPDPQTIHGLNRHRWFASLAKAYWLDRESKYFEALMDEWDFFTERVPFPDETFLHTVHAIGPRTVHPPYWELDMFIRLRNWYWAYWLSLHATEMTPERNAVLLARCLQQFDLVASRGVRVHKHNFTAMQMEALYLWAAALPEFTGMTIWKHNARNCLEGSMRDAVRDDGTQWEESAGYHTGCIRWYGTPYMLGLRNEEPWAEEYGTRLRRMGQYLDAIITPDGNVPLLSDSDRTSGWRAGLSLLKSIFPDLQTRNGVEPTFFSLWASDGTMFDKKPADTGEPLLDVFPDGGIGIARTSPGPDASMAILDNGPNQAGHAHNDSLTVHFEAFGKPVVVDPGRWIYSRDADRSWVVMPQSHNTVVPEKPRTLPWTAQDTRVHDVLASTADLRLGPIVTDHQADWFAMHTTFRGFHDDHRACVARSVFLSTSETHPWLVVIDQITGPEVHPWTHSWLLPSSEPAKASDGGLRLMLDNGLTVSLARLSEMERGAQDDAMFWCPNYGEKTPARWLRFNSRGTNFITAFAFVPEQVEATLPTPVLEQDGARVRMLLGKKTMVFDLPKLS